MKSFFRVLTLAAALVLAALPLAADEGMWMPQQIPDLAEKLRAMGFEGDPAAFADLTGQPMGAIVSLGGCTASFVSPDALIVTNPDGCTDDGRGGSVPAQPFRSQGGSLVSVLPNKRHARTFRTAFQALRVQSLARSRPDRIRTWVVLILSVMIWLAAIPISWLLLIRLSP